MTPIVDLLEEILDSRQRAYQTAGLLVVLWLIVIAVATGFSIANGGWDFPIALVAIPVSANILYWLLRGGYRFGGWLYKRSQPKGADE